MCVRVCDTTELHELKQVDQDSDCIGTTTGWTAYIQHINLSEPSTQQSSRVLSHSCWLTKQPRYKNTIETLQKLGTPTRLITDERFTKLWTVKNYSSPSRIEATQSLLLMKTNIRPQQYLDSIVG